MFRLINTFLISQDLWDLYTLFNIRQGACGIVYLGFFAKGTGDENTFVAIKEIPVRANLDVTDSLL